MTREIALSRGMVALVDDADYERAVGEGSWVAAPNGRTIYAMRRVGSTTHLMHSFLTGMSLVDHRNGNGLDNRRANLRETTHAQNMANKRLYKNSTSGFKGVTQRKRDGRWQAQIQCDKKHYHLGYFDTAEQAARAYDAAASLHFGEFARPNFPQETVS
jgi:hypothetical protein